MVMRKVAFKIKGKEELRNHSLVNRKIDRQYLKESKMIFTLLIQHHKNEMYFH